MGTRIYNNLVNFIKQQYWQRGYDEVITPNMFALDLWEISGHAAKYKDDMFLLPVENGGKTVSFGLKVRPLPPPLPLHAAASNVLPTSTAIRPAGSQR
jgi:threonyl-tRNA synthetase